MNITSKNITYITLETREKDELLDEIQHLFQEEIVNDKNQPRLTEAMRALERHNEPSIRFQWEQQ